MDELKDLVAKLKTGLDKIGGIDKRLAEHEAHQKKWDEERQNLIASGGYRPVGNSMDSLEQRSLRRFGCSHPRELMEVNVGHDDFAKVPDEEKWAVIDLKKSVDIARMNAQICRGDPVDREVKTDKGNPVLAGNCKQVFETPYGKNLQLKVKAFGTGNVNEGLEWVPTVVAAQFIEEFELERMLARQFQPITMPSNPFDLPVQTDITTARIQPEGAVISQNNFKTDKITFDATKFAEFTVMPEELNEDSAPNILALKRREVGEAILRAVETTLLNGDTAGTHQDSDTTAADDARKAWDGLRKLAIANSATVDALNAAVTLPFARSLRAAMDKFGVNEGQLMYVASPKVYFQLTALPEVTSVEKFGPQATILKGALSALDGIPIVISEFARDDLNASGVHDGVTVDRAVLHLINRTRFMLGVRRPIRVRATFDPTPPNDRWLCVGWWRGDFQGHGQSATEKSSVVGINIA